MDLISAISNFQQNQTISQAQILVARQILDMQQMQGGAAVKLIDAADQNFSQAGDALVAAATGLGGQLDMHA